MPLHGTQTRVSGAGVIQIHDCPGRWLCASTLGKCRIAYEPISHRQRYSSPRNNNNGEWQNRTDRKQRRWSAHSQPAPPCGMVTNEEGDIS